MSNTALVLESNEVTIDKRATLKLFYAANHDTLRPVSNPALNTVALIIALQLLDGFLTLTGTYTLGISAEGNPLLRNLMHYVGLIPALLIAKGLCVGIVLTLYIKASSITWLPAALKFVALFYTVGAIIPWSLILFNELL